MAVAIGDIVPLTVLRVEAYGLWGIYDGHTGSVHVSDFTDDWPIDEDRIPQVGDTVSVRVFCVAPRTEVEYAWGKLVCDFAASLVLFPQMAKQQSSPAGVLRVGQPKEPCNLAIDAEGFTVVLCGQDIGDIRWREVARVGASNLALQRTFAEFRRVV